MIKSFMRENKIWAFLPLFLVAGFFYLFFVTQGTFHFMEYRQGIYSNWLADVFLSGRTGVPIDSPEAIPTADGSIYNGTLFLYWGPVPAIIHAAWKLIFQGPIYSSVLTYGFALANITLLWLIMASLLRRFFGFANIFVLYALIISYIAGPLLFNLTRSFVYEEAIVAGSSFLLASIWLITCLGSSVRPRRLLGIGILFGLAVATRFNLIFYLPLVIGYLWLELKSAQNNRIIARSLVITLVPIMITLSLLGYYNFARFGSVSEFGVTYQNASLPDDLHRIQNGQTISWRYIPYNFIHYFLKPVYFTGSGHITGLSLPGTLGPFPKLSRIEQTASVFSFAPLLLLIILSFRSNDQLSKARSFLLVTRIGAGIFLLFGLLPFVGNGYRYIQDFLPILLLLAAPLLQTCVSTAAGPKRYLIYFLVGVLATYSLLIGVEQVCGAYFDGYSCFRFRPITDFLFLS